MTHQWLADRISGALTIKHRLEHVGSTAVPGLAAKPIIDIDLVVGAVEDVGSAIGDLGYRHKGELGIVGREAFDLRTVFPTTIRTSSLKALYRSAITWTSATSCAPTLPTLSATARKSCGLPRCCSPTARPAVSEAPLGGGTHRVGPRQRLVLVVSPSGVRMLGCGVRGGEPSSLQVGDVRRFDDSALHDRDGGLELVA